MQAKQSELMDSQFQFTHPGRGATDRSRAVKVIEVVSIHAPREGCDGLTSTLLASATEFQFTHPGRGATQ